MRVDQVVLLLAVLWPGTTGQVQRGQEDLRCYNDFNTIITCDWNGTRSSDLANTVGDSACTLSAHDARRSFLNSSCRPMPVDPSKPALRRCSVVFITTQAFRSNQIFNINVKCESMKDTLVSILYKPALFIKLRPPGMPTINSTTVSLPEDPRIPTRLIKECEFELHWKREDQAWKDCKTKLSSQCHPQPMQLLPDELEQGETYLARARVQAAGSGFKSTWSEWSRVASWVSTVGKERPPASDGVGGRAKSVLVSSAVGSLVALSLAVIVCKTNRGSWVYMVRMYRGPLLPKPKLAGLNPQLPCECHRSLTSSLPISPVEVTQTTGRSSLQGRKPLPQSPYFSNPGYFCLPALTPPTEGDLKPCAADSNYKPLSGISEGTMGEMTDEEDEQEEEEEEEHPAEGQGDADLPSVVASVRVFTAGAVAVCLDSQEVENLEAQSSRLPKRDLGVVREEEARDSQESFGDVEGVRRTDEGPQRRESQDEEENGTQIEHLFSGDTCGNILSQGSLKICLDYEKIPLLQIRHCRTQSPDSDVCSGGEVSQETLEDEHLSVGTNTFSLTSFSDMVQSQTAFSETPFNFNIDSPSSFELGHTSMGCTLTMLPSSGGYMPLPLIR